jgi:hypothetical protein
MRTRFLAAALAAVCSTAALFHSGLAAADPTLDGFKYGGAYKPMGARQSGRTSQFSNRTQLKFAVATQRRGCFKVAVAVVHDEPLVGSVDFGSGRERLVQDERTGLLLMENEICGDAFEPSTEMSIIVRRQSGQTSQPLDLDATAQVYKAPYGAEKKAASERAVRAHDREFKKRNRAEVCAKCRLEPDWCLTRQGMTRADCQ